VDRDQFFSNLFDENSEQAISARAQRQLAFEERVIKRIFRECGIGGISWGHLIHNCREVTGQQNLNFRWFNSAYRFPAMVYGRRMYSGKRGPRLEALTLRDLLQPAEKNRVYRAVHKILDTQELDEDNFFVFVFPVGQKMFCAHNLVHIADGAAGTRLTFSRGSDSLYIEPTGTLFAAIGTSWWEQ
jgi:hypothetical protein